MTHRHLGGKRPGSPVIWAPPSGRTRRAGQLSVRILGRKGPPVVLLHGLVASGRYWGAAYDSLADGHRLIVPDMLGFGRSDKPTSGYSPDDHVEALVECLDVLGVSEPAIIGAHSLGCLVALRLAATHPERVSGIVGFGPPLYPDQSAARARISGTTMGRVFRLDGAAAHIVCRAMCAHRELAARFAVALHPRLPAQVAADSVAHIWASYSQTLDEVILAADATQWLDAVRCPVRLVAGDVDPVVDSAFLRRLAEAHPNVSVDIWSGDHYLPLTHPTACREAITERCSPPPGHADRSREAKP